MPVPDMLPLHLYVLINQETTVLEESYELPDGRVIKIGRERFEAPEALFNPSLVDSERPSLGDMVFDMIQDSEIDCRAEYYEHIVLSGGTTMFPGFSTRLRKDISNRYLSDVLKGNADRLKGFKLSIEDPPQRKHMVFVGGSILADIMQKRSDFWVTREEWLEEGERALTKFVAGR